MAGWDLKSGKLTSVEVSDDEYWKLFNYVFSDSSKKRNTYKFGLIKAILDNLFCINHTDQGEYLSYIQLFSKFAENYWNLIVKYDLRQMRRDGKSELSKVEKIFKNAVEKNDILSKIEFEEIDVVNKNKIIKQIATECKKCVVGALYEDFEGKVYSFDLKETGLFLSKRAYEFMLRYKVEIEKLNYYSWAKFLEKINNDDVLIRLLDKLELATPRRGNLSVYREILRSEFEGDVCFYCGRKLRDNPHVDHFIPWSFVKDDKIWNFVLSCASCNERKSNKVPTKEYLVKIEERNSILIKKGIRNVSKDFIGYSEDILSRMWTYAQYSGLKEYKVNCNE